MAVKTEKKDAHQIVDINYDRPFLYEYQKKIIDSPARYTVCLAATKCGKTASHIVWLFEQALQCARDPTMRKERLVVDINGEPVKEGGRVVYVINEDPELLNQSVWWVAPTFGQAKIAFNRMKAQLRAADTDTGKQLDKKELFTANETNLIITLVTGVKIEFKTGEKPDNLYGDDVYAFVFDEFTRAREGAWHALRSTITSTGGKGKFIGNAKDKKNWGNKLAMRAKSGTDADYEYHKITAYDAAAAGMMTKDGRPFLEEIEAAKRDLPESVFNELYLAEPSEDGSNPFGLKHIEACCVPELSSQPSICYGVDLGRKVDSTSIIGLDKLGYMSHYDNFVRRSWPHVIDTIKYLPNMPITMDGTGVGDAIISDVEQVQSQVEGYIYTPISKQRLMEGLAVMLQFRRIHIADDGNVVSGTGKLRHQLEQFEVVYTRTGVKYSAPDGDHDDDVCALAMAAYRWQQTAVMGDEISVY
jgi:hypothetical protein